MIGDEMETYTAKHVHQCFPWISASTFNYRAKHWPDARRGKGTGNAIEMTLPQLVHVGVDDELASLGASRGAATTKLPAIIDVRFVPLQGWQTEYDSGKPKDPLDEPPYYYEHTRFNCWVTVDILHPLKPKPGELRRKRSNRIYRVTYHSSMYEFPTAAETHSEHVYKGETWFGVSSARINVFGIMHHCLTTLGMETPVDLVRIWRNIEQE